MRIRRSTTELYPLTGTKRLLFYSFVISPPGPYCSAEDGLGRCLEGGATSLYSSVAEHWSCKPGVESSILSGGMTIVNFGLFAV